MDRQNSIPRKIGIMIGSKSDLLQCEEGMKIVREAETAGKAEMVVFCTNSIHRNTEEVLKNLYELTEVYGVERWVIGAGMANHLTGTCDAFLRYSMSSLVPVFGAVFTAEDNPDVNLQAAILSITQVPGHQVVFDPRKPFFADACNKAIDMDEAPIFPRQPKEARRYFSTDDVLREIEKQRQ